MKICKLIGVMFGLRRKYITMSFKSDPQRHGLGIGVWILTFGAFIGTLPCNAVPLNVANMEGMEGPTPRMRADYGFYPDKNTTSFQTTNYVNLMTANVHNANHKAHVANSIHRSGCRYKATLYASGDNVPTEESCLFCHCKGSVVICKLRVCPEIPDQTPPPGCIIVQKANKCCSQLVCTDNQIRNKLSREQRLDDEGNNATETLPSSALQSLEQGNYCVHEGTVYAEGSAMRSSTLCEHCFCIHGKMKCSSPQCLIPLNGCKPRYRSYACCPTNYDCNQSNETAILKTTPSSTPVPDFLKGCRVGDRYVAEGQPILPMQLAAEHGNNSLGPGINRCQTCFCMGGVVHCRPLACDRPIEGCTPVIEVGHCCPDRYECDKGKAADETTINAIAQDDEEVDTHAPTTTLAPESTSTQVYEVRFEKVPLFKARKDEGGEWTTGRSNNAVKTPAQPRVSTLSSIGGFQNRATGDRGSREHKKNKKDRQEFLSRSFYEDDAGEDASSSVENSGPSDEQSSSVVFDEKSDNSNSNSDGNDVPAETEPSLVTELSQVVTDAETATPVASTVKNVDGDESITEKLAGVEDLTNSDIDTSILPLTLTNDLKLEPIFQTTASEPPSSSTTPPPKLSSSTNPTPTPSAATFAAVVTNADSDSTTVGKLEFISFGAEDAVFSPMNETRYEIYPGHGTSVPIRNYDTVARQGIPSSAEKTISQPKANTSNNYSQREPSVPLRRLASEDDSLTTVQPNEPIIIFDQENLRNSVMDVPVQTSLYNNGFFGQGVVDDAGKTEDLVITQAELDKPAISSENTGVGEAIAKTVRNTTFAPLTTTSKTPARNTAPQQQVPIVTISKKPALPLKAISSNQNFIPSFRPINPPAADKNTSTYPSRTYSKFGMQDSSVYRYGPTTQLGDEEERFFVQLPPSHLIPENIGPAAAPPQLMYRKVPSFNEEPLRYRPHQQEKFPIHILSYDDEEEEEVSDEFGSYESYFNPQRPTQSKQSTSTAPSNTGPKYGTPSTPALTLPPTTQPPNNPIPMISSSGTKVSLSSKDNTRPSPNTKFVNSKPLRRPKPVEEHTPGADPLGFKPVVAFPFTIPKSQDKFSLGLKLSGCNIYGKMYGVGQVIQELSSICVQCKCTEVGVQCSELQC